MMSSGWQLLTVKDFLQHIRIYLFMSIYLITFQPVNFVYFIHELWAVEP